MSLAPASSPAPLAPGSAFSPNDPDRIRGPALRRSLFFNFLTWIPGSFFVVTTTGACAVELGKYLGAKDLLFSFLFVGAPLVSTLFQLPGSLAIDWLRNRKKIYILTVFPGRVLYILIGLLPWMVPQSVAWPAMLMAGLVFLSGGLGNFGQQAWVNWMADLVPPRVRGKYFACCNRLGVVVSALTGLAIAILLDLSHQSWFDAALDPITRRTHLPPLIFLASMVFMIGGAFGTFDPLTFLKVDEAPVRPRHASLPLQRLMAPLRDPLFMRYIAYWSLWSAAVSFCNWLWWVNLLDFFARQQALGVHAWWENHTYLAATLILPIGFQLGQFIGYPVWGRAVDRFGRKPVFFISSVLQTMLWGFWIFLSPGLLPWLIPVQLAAGIVAGGQDIASFNMMLQFNQRGGPGYQAVGTILTGLAGTAGALAAGIIANSLQARGWHYDFAPGSPWHFTFNRYALLIVISMAIKFAADFLLLPRVKDTGGKPAAHALRFVLNNMYGNLNTLLFTPLRTGAQFTRRWWR